MTQPPPPMPALSYAIYCTNASHDFPHYGHGLSCVCGREWLHWVGDESVPHCYEVHRYPPPADPADGA